MKIEPTTCWCVIRDGKPVIGSCRWTRAVSLQVFRDSGQMVRDGIVVQRVEIRAAPTKRKAKRKCVRGRK